VLFITFYTDDYTIPYTNLKRSCDKLGIELYGEGMERGDRTWRQMVAMKPRFIHRQLVKNVGKHDRIVWIDADSRIRKNPDLLQTTKADVSARVWNNRKTVIEPRKIEDDGYDPNSHEPMTGVILFRNTVAVRRFVWGWYKTVRAFAPNVTRPDQRALKKALLEHDNIEFKPLPMSYCFWRRFYPHQTHRDCFDAVIQVSRWLSKSADAVEGLAWIEKLQREDGTWNRYDWEWEE